MILKTIASLFAVLTSAYVYLQSYSGNVQESNISTEALEKSNNAFTDISITKSSTAATKDQNTSTDDFSQKKHHGFQKHRHDGWRGHNFFHNFFWKSVFGNHQHHKQRDIGNHKHHKQRDIRTCSRGHKFDATFYEKLNKNNTKLNKNDAELNTESNTGEKRHRGRHSRHNLVKTHLCSVCNHCSTCCKEDYLNQQRQSTVS